MIFLENTINRKEYRRNGYNACDEYKKRTTSENKKAGVFLNQIINSMLLLLTVLMLKYFNHETEYMKFKEYFSSGIQYETLKENALEIINSSKLNKEKNIILENDNSGEIININITKESGEKVIENDNAEKQYITAIEGINQLEEDAQKIKKDYQIVKPLTGTITSNFGVRVSNSPIVSSYHTGLDIGANTGTIINSAHEGKVIQAGDNGTYGKSVIIESGDLKTVYAHCSSVLVKKGDFIKKGEKIAKVGMTGNATGPHLHFEIRYKERFVNPEDVIYKENKCQ